MLTGVVSPRSEAQPRPVTLTYGSLEHTLLIPSSIYLLTTQLRDEFQSSLLPSKGEHSEEREPSSPAELVSRFLEFISEKEDVEDVVKFVLGDFEGRFLRGNEVHAVARNIEGDSRKRKGIIRAYYTARHISGRPIRSHSSTLMDSVTNSVSKIYAIFGGQGSSEEYFDELREIMDVYNPFVSEFIETMSDLLHQLAKFEGTVYPKGIDVMRWLRIPDMTPDLEYMISAPVSFPVIGIIQLAHYLVVCSVLGKEPHDLRDLISGTTGHSQGIVTAVAIAASTTKESFYLNAKKAITLLFFIGCRSQQIFPRTTLPPSMLQDSLAAGEGNPTPMLSIRDLTIDEVKQHVEATNKHLPEDRQVLFALVNGPRNFVIAGPPQSLCGLNLTLRKVKAQSGLEQGRVPHSERKIKFTNRFLPITCPFHSNYLEGAAETILRDVQDISWTGKELGIPVYATDNGSDLRESKSLIKSLIDMILHLPVKWEPNPFEGATHIVDFGPGGVSGLGALTHRNKDGTGVRIILAGTVEGINTELGYKSELFDREEGSVQFAINWVQKFSPRLVKNSNGTIFVDTLFSRLIGKAPLMVAGMTPSTVSWEFVAATMNAGYHIELAGGGYYSPSAMRAAIRKIEEATTPGCGITVNVIYINPRTYQWQMDLIKQLREEGSPIEGVTIGAGIPSLEIASEVIQNMGLKYVGFKPGSMEGIHQVVAIAKANPEFKIIVQWTGGRAGGHHSFEDFHAPILQMYSVIRRCPNVVLIAGSGFGGAEDTEPYLTGNWALKYNQAPMPFDGILFGSRMMTALENKTSLSAKQAIVDAPGLDDKDWEKTYQGAAGGVVTVKSELGEPIHKLATRGVLLWRELDDRLFSLPKPKRVVWLKEKRDYLIERLNADFQKAQAPLEGEAVDLEDMAYAEVIRRMVELMYIKHECRWIHNSHRNLLGDFIRRVEERFTRETGKFSLLQNYSELDSPFERVDFILSNYLEAEEQLMNTQDCQYFLTICQRQGQKPVPFIPVLNVDIETWFKKDSLWQSEDLAAVVDQDVGRTCILQGPMAARHSTKVNQPIKEILDDIHGAHIKSIKKLYYGNDDSQVPTIEYFGGPDIVKTDEDGDGFVLTKEGDKVTYKVVQQIGNVVLPNSEGWIQLLAGFQYSWRRALFTSDVIVQGKRFLANPLHRLFTPRYGQIVEVSYPNDNEKTVISVFERRNAEMVPAIEVRKQGSEIQVIIFENRNAKKEVLGMKLLFTYHPETGYAPVREVMNGRNDRIKEFYYRLWFGDDPYSLSAKVTDVFEGGKTVVRAKDIAAFCHAVGNQSEAFVRREHKVPMAPMDFAIVVGWKAIIKALFPKDIDGDLLKLVHLSNAFRMITGARPLQEGDEVETTAQINAVVNTESGKMVEVRGTIVRAGRPVMEVTSQFLYRGVFSDFENTFQRTVETPMQLHLKTSKDVAILRSKEWLHLMDPDTELLDRTLIFRLYSTTRYKDRKIFSSVETTGSVNVELPTKEIIQVASVDYIAGTSHGNPVTDYLQRNGTPIEQPMAFDNSYSMMPDPTIFSSVSVAPHHNTSYAEISSDYNPIHVNPYFASYASLPGTITHGMWTSAATRKFVEVFAAENRPERVTTFDVKFLNMVLPNTKLETKLSHLGMVNGKKIVKVETFDQETSSKVLEGTAEIDQPLSAYVFTGQGSQEQGMGMDLYASSTVAQAIWDRADKHFLQSYGFSIINIVKNNPKELTIHFGGPKGKAIRQNYLSMVYDTIDADGTIRSVPIFKEINEDTTSYKFKSPSGLLSATQFTQPALTLMEKAAFEDMKTKGLVQRDCAFAGHSLGEYSALAAIGDVLPIESLVDVVFYRGMTMQVAVPRDSKGRSDYGMCAVNPSRISLSFNESALQFVINHIAAQCSWLLEIVNYNVENQQYVTAGELVALDCLANVLNYLKAQKIDIVKLRVTMSIEDLKTHLSDIVEECAKQSNEKKDQGPVELERGYATIPLKGIDVPFHSSFLRNGVRPFRSYLSKKIIKSQVNPGLLLGRYIPNVTAQPFQITREYIENVYNLTGSPKLANILKDWETRYDQVT
ncbi:Fatty acid synthase subunit beta [Neolecta irregularis DAH-3]|uniref:Fatty acid synthase subunit beta n=1 Tax=Neolecta irregularis (strain DAH-3) TaxID=1198029 RepID=A0A1U7LRK2_NEOID|nr:Fatty acid synthase subunit beta [Neolecta irregularis DAH-3]|eukprot:OLL25295.1 Fatty acid synthase subunit beta [Neolecta irregularis DAH-3]